MKNGHVHFCCKIFSHLFLTFSKPTYPFHAILISKTYIGSYRKLFNNLVEITCQNKSLAELCIFWLLEKLYLRIYHKLKLDNLVSRNIGKILVENIFWAVASP
jgi:hypothetical protein